MYDKSLREMAVSGALKETRQIEETLRRRAKSIADAMDNSLCKYSKYALNPNDLDGSSKEITILPDKENAIFKNVAQGNCSSIRVE